MTVWRLDGCAAVFYGIYNYKRSALRIQPISLSLQTVSHIPRAYRPIPAANSFENEDARRFPAPCIA
ncbi:hypothetical protein SRB521_01395 [Intestinimonas butyriciproducens]|nr:hypothetical protein SRB521_01395 [Intestinimonas butyriciproducens]